MKVHWKYLFSVLLASMLALSWSCSGDQQQEEQVEAGEDGEDEYGEEGGQQEGQQEGDQYAEEGEEGEEGDQYAEGGEEGGEEGNEYANEEGGEGYEGEGGDEVQTIVADLNENQGAEDLGMNGTNVAETNNTLADSSGGASGSAGSGLPEFGSKMPYIVQSGDTLGSISTKVYGAPDRWAQMAELSALPNPSKIFPGDVVYYQLTEETLAFANQYENLPKQEIVVGSGDTLTSISSRVYGSSMDWKFIWRHNDQLVDPDRLSPGDVLYYVDTANLTAEIQIKADGPQVEVASVTVEDGSIVVSVEPIDERYETEGNMFDVFANMIGNTVAG